MKKFNLSLVTVLAMSTFAVAGGDIAPVEEPVVVVPEVIAPSVGGLYLGLGYGLLSTDQEYEQGNWSYDNRSDDYSMVMFQAGYKFNDYVAVEGRYWMGIDDNSYWDRQNDTGVDAAIDSWGIYVKPMYPVTDAFDIYALLGYASSDYEMDYDNGLSYNSDDLDGFSWGIGAAYSFTDSIAVFVDYVSLYSDTYTITDVTHGDIDVDDTLQTWNFGVTYTF